MSRRAVVALVCLGGVVVVSALVLGLVVLRHLVAVSPPASSGYGLPGAPSEPSRPSLAVVAIADSAPLPLAVGFAQALADQLHCAPECLTQQYTDFEMDYILRGSGTHPRTLSKEAAAKAAKSLGVDCLVAVRLRSAGGGLRLDAIILRTGSEGSSSSVQLAGTRAGLPKMQTDLAKRVVSALGLRLTAEQIAGIGKPSFSAPAALEFYGSSRTARTMAEAESLRRRMLKADPGSIFANVQFVSLYARGPADCVDIQRAGAAAVLGRAEAQWPRNSLVRSLRAPLLARLYRYEQAQSVAMGLVRSDPDFAQAHADLSAVARRRRDTDLAVLEGQWYAALYPGNPFAHSALARAYLLTADNARRGHYHSKISWLTERKWRIAIDSCAREARTAVEQFPHCGPAWRTFIVAARELSDPGIGRAFSEARQSDPNNLAAYVEYGFALSPQWGGSRKKQAQILNLARERFGSTSRQAQVVEAALRQYSYSAEHTLGGRYEEDTLLPCTWNDRIQRDLRQSTALAACRNYLIAKQRDDVYATAKAGFETWQSPIWRHLYGMGCSFRYEDQRDTNALYQARNLFAACAREVPFEPSHQIRWGWCLSHLGDREEAKARFLRALELDPQNDTAKQKLQYVQ